MKALTLFPLSKLCHLDKVRSCIHDERHAEFELEEYNTDIDDGDVTILDCLGRRVHLVIDDHHVFKSLILLSDTATPADLDLIAAYKYVPSKTSWPFERARMPWWKIR